MVLKIKRNGTFVDISKWIAADGFKWTRYDIDAPKAGRTMDGTMQRGRVATKIKMEITCIPLDKADLKVLLNLLLPQYITVEYDDPMYGHRTGTFYSNNNPASFYVKTDYGKEYYKDIKFPLVER